MMTGTDLLKHFECRKIIAIIVGPYKFMNN